MSTGFDVAVVGAGSAGCALAARLSEDPNCRVVLLEAGGDARRDPRVSIPVLFVTLHGSRRDWAFRTETQPQLENRRLRWPRGRALGGSSAINYLAYIRGDPACYDEWERVGCDGWAYRDVLPAFKRLEDHALGASAHHGEGGPVRVSAPRWRNPLTEAFLEAAEQAGLPLVEDLDSPGRGSAGRYFVTVRDGQRESAATAYLSTAEQRPNLEIRTGTLAHRLLVRDERVHGIEVSTGRQVEQISADAVVLCAGAIGSPTLLLRSGIGPVGDLRQIDVRPQVDSPEVGANLSDHLLAPVVYGGPMRMTMPAAALRPGAAIAYLRDRSGPWSSNAGEAGVICRSQSDATMPDLQLTLGFASLVNHGRTRPQCAFSIGVVGLQPRSRGRLWLSDAAPTSAPKIDPGYLCDERDVGVMLDGIALARRIARSAAFAPLAGREREPGAQLTTEVDLASWLRRRAETSYHPVGTCRMGSDPHSVVDPRLRVRGVDRLWVADASVMPIIVSANTNAACLMIGERAADFLREDLTPG